MNINGKANQYVAITKIMTNVIQLRRRKFSVIIYLSGFLLNILIKSANAKIKTKENNRNVL